MTFSREDYSKEELIAQLGAAFFCAEHGLTDEHQEERDASYLASWIKVLKADPAILFDAGQSASKAVDFIHEKASEEAPVEA